ncbi:MAG: hypothetical protein COV76_00630 [Candidatus Omnitrophica bacterium CG11_big_fil_rev_8_21_14_0_20_64_10]|nr:MAG: hypothetical protein COV76_00630 [Candidatus Omnitrophica bacterium CG11_big_fil_rev_8_21_14_0_20_64_10]
MVRIGAFSRHRKVVNDLHRMGKNYFIRMRTDWNGTQPAKMVLKEPVNAVRSARRVERERARLLREARGRAAHREDFAVRYGPFQGGEGGQPVEPPPILPDEAPTAPSPRETTYEPRPNADQPPIEVTPEDIVPLEESGPPVTPFDEETDWLNQPQPRRENEQNQAGLEAGRRDFLKQAVAGLAVTGAVSLASGDLAAQPPAAAPAQGTVPPAAVPAVGGYIDAQRRIEGEMLRLHADISASRVDLFEREAVRQVAVRLRDAQAISQHELDSYLLLLEQRPVASAYARLMDLHRELIRSDGSDRDGRWAAYAAALDAHIRAEESNLRENIAFMDRAIPVVQGLAERKILTADEVEPFIAVRDKSRLLLGKFSHQRAIYRILYRLRTQLPLAQIPQPADLARNILVALPTFLPATDPQAREGLPYGERRKLRLQMREEVAALLELEQQIYSIEIELWRRQVDRKEDLARQSPGAVTRTELGLGRMLLKRADLYQALQEFLRAQAHLALQEDRRDEVAAQERVDQEVMALMQALEGFESGWVQFWREEQTRIALSNAQVPGAVPQWEIREARAEELLAQRRVEKVQAVQRAYPHLQALGLPLGPLEGTTPRALAFDPKNLLPDYSSSTAVFYPGKTVTEYALPSGPTSGIDITPLGISKGPVKKTASGASYRDITYASITEHRRNPLTAPSIGPAGSGLLPAEAMVAAPIVGVDQPLTPGEVEAHVEAIEQVEADLARIKVAEIQHLIDLANYRAATIDELYAKHVEPLWKQQDIAHERRKGAVLGVWQEVILAEIEVMHAQTEQEFTAAVGRLDFLNQRRTEVEISRTDDRIHVLRSRLAQMRANPGPYGQLAIDKTAAEQALLQIHRRELGRQQDWYAALSDEGIPMVLPETAQAIPPTPSLMDRMDLEEEVQLFGYVWELRAEGRWELVPVSSPGWMYLARPTLAEFQNRIAWRLGAYIWDEEIGRYKMKNRVVKLQADLSAHPQINPSGRTSHATVKVAWDGFWSQREGKSGWYYVLGDRVIKLRPTQAGVIPLAEKPTAGTSPFEGREALILFAVGSVEQIGENDLEHAFNPIGVLEFRVPLSSYTNDLPEHPERIVREFLASGKTLPNGRKVYGTFRRAQKVHWDSAVEPGQLLTTDVIHGPSGGEPVWQEPVFVQMEIPGTKRLVWDGEIRLRDVSGDELAARAGERESAEAGPPQDAAAVREALEAAVRQGTAVAGTQSGLEAGPPQPFSSLADPGSAAPSKVRESEGVGPSVSPAAARPEGGQGAAAGRLSAGGLEELQPPMAPVVAVAGVGIAARVEFLQGRIYGPDLEDSMTARVELRTLQESAARSAVAGWLEISAEPAALEQAVVFHLDTVETAGFAPGILLGGGSVAVLTDTLTQAAGLNELIADLERETGRPGLTDRLIVRSEEEFGGDRAAALGALAGAIPAGVTVERVPPASTLEAVEQLLARYGLTFQSGGLEAATRATTDYLESLA